MKIEYFLYNYFDLISLAEMEATDAGPSLHAEMQQYILSFADEVTLVMANLVCREWRDWLIPMQDRLKVFARKTWGNRVTKDGSVGILKWIQETCPNPKNKFIHEKSITFAAEKHQWDMVKYLHEQGCAWDPNIYKHAATAGNLEFIKWARERKLPWNTAVFRTALVSPKSTMEMLEYLLLQGCPRGGNDMKDIAKDCRTDYLCWAITNLDSNRVLFTYHFAVKHIRLDLAQELWDLGGPAPKNHNVYQALLNYRKGDCKRIELIEWFRTHGCTLDETTMTIVEYDNQY
jgi:hypothetical protein